LEIAADKVSAFTWRAKKMLDAAKQENAKERDGSLARRKAGVDHGKDGQRFDAAGRIARLGEGVDVGRLAGAGAECDDGEQGDGE
jgi:hypothetical protein